MQCFCIGIFGLLVHLVINLDYIHVCLQYQYFFARIALCVSAALHAIQRYKGISKSGQLNFHLLENIMVILSKVGPYFELLGTEEADFKHPWLLSCGCYLVAVILWLLSCGCYSIGHKREYNMATITVRIRPQRAVHF